jgi:antitoxin (DNA-binding transcriptional repressor) of toxin-antitoxin stability system
MKSVPAAKFKEHCLTLLHHLPPDGIVITKHGKPVAKLIPIHAYAGKLRGKG